MSVCTTNDKKRFLCVKLRYFRKESKMSYWTYINGVITVTPMGRTQAEKRYILETVLDHLPVVTGSEGSMSVYIVQKNGESSIGSRDEFGYKTNNLTNAYGLKTSDGWLRCQDEYLLVINGSLRDREFERTLFEFNKWLCRLAKRIDVEDILVRISGYDKTVLFDNNNSECYKEMCENPSWVDEKSYNWCEYLMWERGE